MSQFYSSSSSQIVNYDRCFELTSALSRETEPAQNTRPSYTFRGAGTQ